MFYDRISPFFIGQPTRRTGRTNVTDLAPRAAENGISICRDTLQQSISVSWYGTIEDWKWRGMFTKTKKVSDSQEVFVCYLMSQPTPKSFIGL